MLRPTYPILTERLALRPFTEGDFDSLYAIQSHAEVAKYLYWEPRNAEQVRENLARRLTKTELRDGRCDGRNLASTRVMRKAGMRCEAHLRENEFVKGEWCDELIYAILRSEWTTSGPY